MADAQILHPEWEDNWKVKAYIIGISESNSIEIKFKKVIKKFAVIFSDNNRTVTVGPLKSFMDQMIPDGLQVNLAIYKRDELLNTLFEKSKDGYVVFNLNSNIYKNGNYALKITSAGITETFQTVRLW